MICPYFLVVRGLVRQSNEVRAFPMYAVQIVADLISLSNAQKREDIAFVFAMREEVDYYLEVLCLKEEVERDSRRFKLFRLGRWFRTSSRNSEAGSVFGIF
ncbi:hypothetical protein HY620_00120 [Candidatus Uhrbacteria bacterium]|nr:hypothetical protein [Candidatus Uhrbacteria bacterium]